MVFVFENYLIQGVSNTVLHYNGRLRSEEKD